MQLLNRLFVCASLLLAFGAAAQGSPVSFQLQASRIETVEGKTVRKAADSGRPGDLIEYAGTYRNNGKSAVAKLAATIPIPPGTTFVAASNEPAGALASVDGASFAAMPLMRTVRKADGTSRQEPVPVAEYRYVRWEIGTLPAGREAVVSLRVRVDTPDAVAAK